MIVVFVAEVAGDVLCDVLNQLQVDGGSNDKGEWSKEDCCTKEGFVVPLNTTLR